MTNENRWFHVRILQAEAEVKNRQFTLPERFNLCCPTPKKCADSMIPSDCPHCGWKLNRDNSSECDPCRNETPVSPDGD